MRNVALVCVLLAVGVAGQQAARDDTFLHEPKAKRTLPADVLRDFPTMCFASSRCQAFPVGATWQLGSFCGQSTCMKNETGFFEQVEDCGTGVKPNKGCQEIPPTGPDYPNCCPKYECAQGVQIEEYTPDELVALAKAREEEFKQQQAANQQQPAATQA